MMKTLLVLTVLVAVALSIKININPKTEQVIVHDTWVEEKNDLFKDVKVKSLLGWNGSPKPKNFPVRTSNVPVDAFPTNFDSRAQWPNCSTVSTVYNQARCGSCWAFACVESVQDRFCTMNNVSVNLSFQDLVTCDQNDDGCQGGDAYSAYQYVQKKGLVTAECSPYTVPTCPPAQQPCLNFVNTPPCVQKCVANYTSHSYTQDKHFVDKIYTINDVNSMVSDIATYGPIEACFNVYEDFLGYKSGVYQHTTGKLLGGHCVRLLGYGVENGTNYWLAANSWTTYWGDVGMFKILKGKNECGIESDVVGGYPKN